MYGEYHFPVALAGCCIFVAVDLGLVDRTGRSNNVSGQKNRYKIKCAKFIIASR